MKTPVKSLKNACRQYEEDLVLYYYGELAGNERSNIEGHVETCEPCRLFVEDLRGLLPRMSESKELPQSFWDNYYRETVGKLAEETERRAWWRRWLAVPQGWLVPAFGSAAVAVFALALLWADKGGPVRSETAAAPIPQEIMADANQLEFFKALDMLESLDQLEEQDRKLPGSGASGSELGIGSRNYA